MTAMPRSKEKCSAQSGRIVSESYIRCKVEAICEDAKAGRLGETGRAAVAFLSIPSAFHKFWHDKVRNDAGLVAFGQQPGNRITTHRSKVERPLVDVHLDELVGFGMG